MENKRKLNTKLSECDRLSQEDLADTNNAKTRKQIRGREIQLLPNGSFRSDKGLLYHLFYPIYALTFTFRKWKSKTVYLCHVPVASPPTILNK